jgi:hypothetical protein
MNVMLTSSPARTQARSGNHQSGGGVLKMNGGVKALHDLLPDLMDQ